MEPIKKFKLEDYKEYPFEIRDIFLDISINENSVDIYSILSIFPKDIPNNELILKGSNIDLRKIKLDKKEISKDCFSYKNNELVIYSPPKRAFTLEISSKVNPYTNTSLEGLYESSGILTTQCEAEGFRRICFHPDRPDVLSKFRVRIEANRKQYPVLLSNGNKISSTILKEDKYRHEVIWEDPFPKPSYLFALVAGKLTEVKSYYKSLSGKEISIHIFVEEGDEKYTKHAIDSLKKAMLWDEQKYNLEYDLNLYNIVAVRHFNMGAMENKSLNIFNSKLVLADEQITTDTELERIESVIAHEYFHNWTGNRITCRDWFQLSLKEGLTVFRDQSFTEDLHCSNLKRIEDVSLLRNIQFKEDSSPTCHPVKPSEYIAIDNFYTTTIYEKGAEIIRMLNTLLGNTNFMSGMRKYINDYDGSAATTEDFVNSIIIGAENNHYRRNFSITQFNKWYYQSGTPLVSIIRKWDKEEDTLTLTISQENSSNDKSKIEPLVIPVNISIINSKIHNKEKLLILDEEKKLFKFNNISTNNEFPIVSIFRKFSAPVKWKSDLTIEELIYISENDDDLFSRWNSLNSLCCKALLSRSNGLRNDILEGLLINSYSKNIIEFSKINPGFLSKILTIPIVSELELYQNPINPIALNSAYYQFKLSLAKSLKKQLEHLLDQAKKHSLEKWPKGDGHRKLIEVIWSLLILNGNQTIRNEALEAINGTSMTLAKAALNSLVPVNCPERDEGLNLFFNKWKNNPVVLDSWFNLQSSIQREDSIEFVQELLNHPLFDPIAPNSIRAVLGGFSKNVTSFHSNEGKGYLFIAEQIAEVDKRNPITASRILKVFIKWRNYIEPNQTQMLKAIHKLEQYNLSSNTKEILDLISS